MSDIRDLLRSAAATPRAAPDIGGLLGRIRRRKRQRSIALATTLSLTGILAAAALAVSLRDDGTIEMVPPVTSQAPATTEPATTQPTPTEPETSVANTTVPAPPSVVEVPTATTTPASSTTTSSTTTATSSPPIVTGPNGLRLVNVRIVGPNGTPFPKGTVEAQACPTSGDPCVFGQAVDNSGTVALELDPAVPYNVNAMARNTGWPNPWVSPTGIPFHFSDATETTGAELTDDTALVVDGPSDPVARGQQAMSTLTAEFDECRSDPEAKVAGDNAGCDSLRGACKDGDLLACNDLYYSSNIMGSANEMFGASCGDRITPAEGRYEWAGFCEGPP